MSRFISPLRYPGGKGKMYRIIKRIIINNQLTNHIYTEPFAGGSAIGLKLLYDEVVNRIVINDFDKSIYAFWYSVLYNSEKLVQLIEETPVTLNEWFKQKDIQKNKSIVEDLLILGFSTLFLNRTNRSGVINGGPIGGKHQSGNYLIDCRFNKTDIIRRIHRITLLRDRIELYNLNATDLLNLLETRNEDYFINMDPPYYVKGKQLYMNFFTHEDHINLRDKIHNSRYPWIITYDNVTEISNMYDEFNIIEYCLTYTAGNVREGKEILIHNNTLEINDNIFIEGTL
ncbi:DNA adenine methylase [Mycoplasmatota bacterium]|nr:DNA adenine methylase [Mycoplasmatota bacterium]